MNIEPALKELSAIYREVMDRNFPAMTCVQVARLMEARAKVDSKVAAVVPDCGVLGGFYKESGLKSLLIFDSLLLNL